MPKVTTCCGLAALEKITSVKTVSMFSLIHLARDNGLNLYFCKVEPEELVAVTRPAIFHQKDHFVFIENGNPMPPGEYDGYVLTTKPLHEPLPHSLAKKIRGRKKAGRIIGTIVTGVASLINPLLGAAVGAGFAGYNASKQPGGLAKNWWEIPLGGATGYLQGASGGSTFGINNATLAAGLAAAGQVPGAIKSGNWMAPIAAGIGQYAGANIIGGAQVGASQAGGGLMNEIGGAIKGGIGTITGAAQKFAGGGATPGSGVEIAKGAAGTTPAGYGGTYTVPGVGNSVVGLPGVAGPAGIGFSAIPSQMGASALAGGASSRAATGGWDFSSLLGKGAGGLSGGQILGTAASALLPQPKLNENTPLNYAKAAQYLGGDNWNALPTATKQQLEQYTNMSITDLTTQFTQQNQKALDDLETARQKQIDAISVQYASYGQDPQTSTQAQQALTEINRQYDQAKAEVTQQVQNQAQTQAVQFKQQMLQASMQQGQFDYNAAMELATYMGRDQELQYALQSKDQAALQQVLVELFSPGISSKK